MRPPLPAEFRVEVPAVGARPIHAMPPGIVQEEPTSPPLQSVIDEGRWIPVGRTSRPGRFEPSGMQLQEDMVGTGRCCQCWPTGHDRRIEDHFAVIISPQPLTGETDYD